MLAEIEISATPLQLMFAEEARERIHAGSTAGTSRFRLDRALRRATEFKVDEAELVIRSTSEKRADQLAMNLAMASGDLHRLPCPLRSPGSRRRL